MKVRTAPWILGALVAAYLFSGVSPAAAQSQEETARASFRLGRAHYDNGDFMKAAKEFEKAYEISGKSELLYNVYLAYRDANMSRQAAGALRGYLANTADVPNRGQLAARLKVLEKGLEDEKKKEPAPAAVVVPPAPPAESKPKPEPVAEETAPEPEPEPEPEAAAESEEPAEQEATAEEAAGEEEPASGGMNLVPIVLMGSGGAMVLGSIITGVMASSAQSELEDKCPDKQCPAGSDLESTQSRGQTLMVVTDVLLFGGIAVAGTGLVLFLLDGAEQEPASEAVAANLGCSPTGCAGSVTILF